MATSVLQFRPREAPAAPDPRIKPAASLLRDLGWSALDAFHAGFPADLCAVMLIAEASSS